MPSPRLTLATLPLRNRASAADGGWIHIVALFAGATVEIEGKARLNPSVAEEH